MAVDMLSVARAAAQAALEDVTPSKKKGLSAWRGLAIGAALVTVGRFAAGPGARFVRERVQEQSSNGSREDGPEQEQDEDPELEQDERDEDPELEQDDEPEAEADDDEPEADDEPDAEADDDEPEADDEPDAEADDDEPEADDEPDAEADDDEPDAEPEQDEQTDAQGEGDRSGRSHHPFFERALAGENVQRRGEQAPKTGPPRRPRRPRASAGGG